MCQSVYYFVKEQFKLVVTFSPIFWADTKLIFGYNLVAPLITRNLLLVYYYVIPYQKISFTMFKMLPKNISTNTVRIKKMMKVCNWKRFLVGNRPICKSCSVIQICCRFTIAVAWKNNCSRYMMSNLFLKLIFSIIL